MRPEKFPAKPLLKLFEKNKVVSIDELKDAIGTDVNKTVFRKLKGFSYRTSYSHRGKFYTLDRIASFDSLGLWSYNYGKFSIYGTLLNTVDTFVDKSEKGYSSRELESIIGVEVKEPLLQLFRKKHIFREKISTVYIYCSKKITKRRRQIKRRTAQEESLPISPGLPELKVLANELKAAIVIFFSLLNEKHQRLYAGLESIKLGHGGDRKISELLGIELHTVAKGRSELLNKKYKIDTQCVRKKGGGRQTVKKNSRSDG